MYSEKESGRERGYAGNDTKIASDNQLLVS